MNGVVGLWSFGLGEIKIGRKRYSVRFLFCEVRFGLFVFLYETFLNAGLLAGEIAQVVKFCATYFTELVDCD